MKTVKKPAGRYVTLAQVIWTWAKLERSAPPLEGTYQEAWATLETRHGKEAVNAAADSYDRDLYITQGWEGAL